MAQAGLSEVRRNGIYAEVYLVRADFSTGFISINYERVLGKKRRASLRLGIYPDFESTISIPLTMTWVTGPLKRHHFEYGIGGVYRLERYESRLYRDVPALMIPLMYRYQKKKGLFFRAGINLFVSWPATPSPSFSLGHKF